MNYRHAFHAGNFADVVKHAVLARILAHLKEKPAAFRVIDTHAGAGVYDLSGPEASRTGEWREGIGRLLAAELDPDERMLLAPYLDAVAALNRGGLKVYPGSPALALSLLREQDRLTACEREPGAARALREFLHGDARAKGVEIDGYVALNAYVPPKERRGLVLIDPPYEQADEFEQLGTALSTAYRKWPTGVYALWYPLKNLRETAAFARRVAASGIARVLRIELSLAHGNAERLGGSGLIVVNPPWRLEIELSVLLPTLARALGAGERGMTRLDWLAREK